MTLSKAQAELNAALTEQWVRAVVREEIKTIVGGVLAGLVDGPAGLSPEQEVQVARVFDEVLETEEEARALDPDCNHAFHVNDGDGGRVCQLCEGVRER